MTICGNLSPGALCQAHYLYNDVIRVQSRTDTVLCLEIAVHVINNSWNSSPFL